MVFILTIFCQLHYAQVVDDFSDGNFTTNPVWSGNVGLFTAAANELNSQSAIAGNYYLSTPSTLGVNAQWDFYFNLKFSTSGANYVDVYLMADVADLTSVNNGYFVRIGGTPDEVSLYKRVAGTSIILIDGPDGSLNNSSNNPFNVSVTRDIANNWTLFYDDGAASSLLAIGSVVDNSVTTSSFFGVAIKQSGAASPKNNHFFDNFSVGTIVGDTASPNIDSLVVVNATNLDVYFNEPVELFSSQMLANYTGDFGLGNPNNALRDVLDSSIVHLTFATPFANGKSYNLSVKNIADTLANSIVSKAAAFTRILIIPPNSGDVIINEIFADPSPQVGLPTEEFVELYNNSNTTFFLKNWQFINTATAKSLPNFTLFPNKYVILCDVNDTALYTSYGDVIGITSFAGLTNGGDSLTLTNPYGNIIDKVVYDVSWYQDAVKDAGGWSLELINPKHPCTSSMNWKASTNASGGTPGSQNDVYDTLPDLKNPNISNISIQSTSLLTVVFNEIMDSASLINAVYTINNGIVVSGTVIHSNKRAVDLTLSSALDSSSVYTLTISGGRDCSGNLINQNNYNFGMGKVPLSLDVLFTEFFPDPSPSIGLPMEEYLELFNNTTKIIDLANCWISDKTKAFQIDSGKLWPGEYAIICDDNFENQYAPFGKVITVSSLPSLSNNDDEITLWDTDSNQIHSVHYFDTWYQDADKSDGGWSLEMIDPNNPCGELNNWKASTNTKGGTPGTQNSVNQSNPDVNLPLLKQANALSDSLVQLTFSEQIESASLLAANYSLNNGVNINKITVLDGKNVLLNLSNKLKFLVLYTVTVKGVSDCAGNIMTRNNTANFALPEQAKFGDLVINEVLFNPYTGGSDFVELYNKSNKYINLQNWNLANIENDSISNYKVIATSPYLLYPDQFVLLTKDPQNVEEEYINAVSKTFLQMETLPNFSNDNGTVVLMNDSNKVVDNFTYNEDMHFSLLDNVKGVSLERIDYNRPSNDVTNWNSAAEGVGFATPGIENSQYQRANEGEDEINVYPETFSPDNDGMDDVLTIFYQFPVSGFVANSVIYDAKGRRIKTFLQNELLGTSGTFSWDGITDQNEKGRIGIYIIFVEVFDLNGNIKTYKNTCVLAGRLN